MLNKELCKKCMNTYADSFLNKERLLTEWNMFDERRWEEDGLIVCPFDYKNKREGNIRKIDDKPPNCCPFYLEQVI